MSCTSYYFYTLLGVVLTNKIPQTMIKRKFDSETYTKMGHPDIGSKIYMKTNGKRRWGIVTMLSFIGFKGASKGLVLIGIEPFRKKRS